MKNELASTRSVALTSHTDLTDKVWSKEDNEVTALLGSDETNNGGRMGCRGLRWIRSHRARKVFIQTFHVSVNVCHRFAYSPVGGPRILKVCSMYHHKSINQNRMGKQMCFHGQGSK